MGTTMWAICLRVERGNPVPVDEFLWHRKGDAIRILKMYHNEDVYEVRKVSVTVLPKNSRKKAEVSR